MEKIRFSDEKDNNKNLSNIQKQNYGGIRGKYGNE